MLFWVYRLSSFEGWEYFWRKTGKALKNPGKPEQLRKTGKTLWRETGKCHFWVTENWKIAESWKNYIFFCGNPDTDLLFTALCSSVTEVRSGSPEPPTYRYDFSHNDDFSKWTNMKYACVVSYRPIIRFQNYSISLLNF